MGLPDDDVFYFYDDEELRERIAHWEADMLHDDSRDAVLKVFYESRGSSLSGGPVWKCDNRWYAFEDYSDEVLNARIEFWEGYCRDDGVLQCLYDERDRRFEERMLARVEQK